jgi:hypothetical protein
LLKSDIRDVLFGKEKSQIHISRFFSYIYHAFLIKYKTRQDYVEMES